MVTWGGDCSGLKTKHDKIALVSSLIFSSPFFSLQDGAKSLYRDTKTLNLIL